MPEYESIRQQLSEISRQWKAKLDTMKHQIQALKETFKAKKVLYTEAVRTKKKQRIEQKVKQRQQFLEQKFGSNGKFFKIQKRLLKPLQQKIYKAINSVSKRKHIDFVFDRAQNSSLLYAREKWNLNDEILSELGITLNQ